MKQEEQVIAEGREKCEFDLRHVRSFKLCNKIILESYLRPGVGQKLFSSPQKL